MQELSDVDAVGIAAEEPEEGGNWKVEGIGEELPQLPGATEGTDDELRRRRSHPLLVFETSFCRMDESVLLKTFEMLVERLTNTEVLLSDMRESSKFNILSRKGENTFSGALFGLSESTITKHFDEDLHSSKVPKRLSVRSKVTVPDHVPFGLFSGRLSIKSIRNDGLMPRL